MGAFKFRGAFNTLSNFTDEEKKNGVIAFSTGNLAVAVSISA
jgi:threonine dehydratase